MHSYLLVVVLGVVWVGRMLPCYDMLFTRALRHSRTPGRFAEVESTTILTRLVMHYKVSITEEPQFAHETFKQKKQRVLSY
jgi:hypothetical protein